MVAIVIVDACVDGLEVESCAHVVAFILFFLAGPSNVLKHLLQSSSGHESNRDWALLVSVVMDEVVVLMIVLPELILWRFFFLKIRQTTHPSSCAASPTIIGT